MAATEPRLKAEIEGCAAVGRRAARPGKYSNAARLHHRVTPCISEVFGAMGADGRALLEKWARKARSRTPEGEEPPWSARNYRPYWTQLLSIAAQRGAAREIGFGAFKAGAAAADRLRREG